MQRIWTTCLLVIGLLFAQSPIAADARGADVVGVASMIDGDTIEVHGQRIRLFGIDAPESRQLCETTTREKWRCGQSAALALSDYVGRTTVSCVRKDKDRYGRIVAICSKENKDINAWMVENGWALAYRQYSVDYVSAEASAEHQKKGIWNGRFVEPWSWRRGSRLTSETRSQRSNDKGAQGKAECLIKGNISRSGERIYHVPGGQYYSRTKISPNKGERWFCSEEEARSAGWRRSKR